MLRPAKGIIGYSKRSFFLVVDILSSLLCTFYLLYSFFICQPLPPRLATFHTVSVFLTLFFLNVFLVLDFCQYRVPQNSLSGHSEVPHCNCVQFLSVSYSQYLKKNYGYHQFLLLLSIVTSFSAGDWLEIIFKYCSHETTISEQRFVEHSMLPFRLPSVVHPYHHGPNHPNYWS